MFLDHIHRFVPLKVEYRQLHVRLGEVQEENREWPEWVTSIWPDITRCGSHQTVKAIEFSASITPIPVVTGSRKHDMLVFIYPLKEIGKICSDIIAWYVLDTLNNSHSK
jgi:hypothetical protein